MSDPFEKQPVSFPLPGIISILVALLAIFAEQFEPLQSSRPLVPEEVKQLSQPLESIDARLWQDPIALVKAYATSSPVDKQQGEHELKTLGGNIVNHQPQDSTKPVIILGVMVFGEAYAELAEFRLRTRYAVLSGLAEADYVPEDVEHIRFYNTSASTGLPRQIPFEWFVNKQGKQNESPILLLWMNESEFKDQPLQSIQNWVTEITKSVEKDVGQSSESKLQKALLTRLKFKFIGPAGSSLLIKMVKERVNNGFDENIFKEPLEFYIASATADEKVLLQNAVPKTQSQNEGSQLSEICFSSLSECFKSVKTDKNLVNFTRVIAQDGNLIKSILDELKIRGVDPVDDFSGYSFNQRFSSKSHIALISEWDTFYGRSMPDVMINLVNDQFHANATPEFSTCVSKENDLMHPPWLHLYSYMRGLDGMVPGMAGSKENKLKAQQQNGSDKKNVYTERAEGQSQKDYLRRLAQRIDDTNDCLHRNNEGEIRAFGILGSDVYDKLMVLTALKSKFPRALFFTTDLDARLIHPEEYEATRNLIVASSFGFQVHPNLQGKIPPFRDSYSTAYFLATQIALNDAVKPEAINQEAIDNMRNTPRIFELGFQKAFDLATTETGSCPFLSHCKNLHPAGYTAMPGRKIAVTLFLAFCFAVLLAFLLNKAGARWINHWFPLHKITTFKQEALSNGSKWFSKSALTVALGILAISLIIAVMESQPEYQGEPFAWVAGVSLWPSIFIRLLAGILCWIFIFKVLHDLPTLQTKLAESFFLREQKHSVMDVGGFERLLRPWKIKLNPDAGNMEMLWHSYMLATQSNFLKSRAIQSFFIYQAFGFCLVLAFGLPLVPYRGLVSLVAHWLVLVPTIIGFILLIMLIIDATRFCIKFIDILEDQRILWPEKTLNHFGFQGAKPLAKTDALIDSEICRFRQELAKKYHLGYWIDIQFITAFTKEIGCLIYYPFIVLALLVFALTPIFDNWYIPMGLALVFIISALFTLIYGLLLRRAAEHCRNSALKSLTITLMAVRGCEEKSAKILESQLTLAIDQIKSIREGAFLPLTHEPAIQALLLPLGGWGGFTLLEHVILR